MDDFAAAALIALPFAAYLLLLALFAPPSEAEWACVDPILRLFPRSVVPWGVPLAGVLTATAWVLRARPTRAVLLRGVKRGGLGALAATALVLFERLVVGDTLPSFIPTEESAAPGLLLSMSAGYLEELVCRLGVLALAWRVLSMRAPRVPAIALSSLACGLSFALLHRLGEAEPSNVYFITRLVVPGIAFSVAALVLRPTFVVVAHCTAHLFLPVLFTPPG